MLHSNTEVALAYLLAFAFAAYNSRILATKSISWRNIGPSVATRNGQPPFVAIIPIYLVTPPQPSKKISLGKVNLAHTTIYFVNILEAAYWHRNKPRKTTASEQHGNHGKLHR
jgi:hypothetical protein